ncbi:hypothetical protein QAD02_010717 [Eretmocerus hayati]|uniref:Uncharacterized protein n=1 Tax=Eretmocerus hayati TaxID=131215 RepID=A0ACC2NUU6_9HYME|nr:hypothetical protein QAD02_010717 [Eretmocerus hayati]
MDGLNGEFSVNENLWSSVRKQRSTFRQQILGCHIEAHNQLKTAIRSRDRALVQQLVDNGAKVNGVFDLSFKEFDPCEDPAVQEPYPTFTPLHLAVISKDAEIVRILLDKGANTNVQVCNEQGGRINITVNMSAVHWAGYSSLHFAIHFECVETVGFLLDCGADITIKNAKTCTPLHLANLLRHERVIDLLLKAHKNEFQNPTNADGLSHFHIAFSLLSNETDSDVSESNHPKLSDLHNACIHNEAQEVETLLSSQVISLHDLDEPIWNGWTPLHLAANYKSNSVVSTLLNQGTNILMIDTQGRTPLHLAFKNRLEDICMKIVRYINASTANVTDCEGLSIFHISCALGHIQAIEHLLANGVDINSQVGSESAYWAGFTPMNFAVNFVRPLVVDVFLRHGADVTLVNGLNLNPYDHILDRLGIEHWDLQRLELNFTILMKILLYVSERHIHLNNRGISLLHCLAASGETNVEQYEEYYDQLLSSRTIQASVDADFIDKCDQELLAMRDVYIDHYTNLYSILFKSLNAMTVHFDNVSLQNIIESAEFPQKYPMFGFVIKQQVIEGRIRKPLLDESKKSLGRIFNRSLPRQCLETILDRLSNADLRNIIESK